MLVYYRKRSHLMTGETSIFVATSSKERRSKDQLNTVLEFDPTNEWLRIQYKQQFPMKFNIGDIQDFNNDFIDILEDLRLQVQQEGIKLSEADKQNYLARLVDVGEAAFNKLFSEEAAKFISQREAKAEK